MIQCRYTGIFLQLPSSVFYSIWPNPINKKRGRQKEPHKRAKKSVHIGSERKKKSRFSKLGRGGYSLIADKRTGFAFYTLTKISGFETIFEND